MLDGFLELRRGGKPAVHGETQDKVFSDPKRQGIEIYEFELESEIDLASHGMMGGTDEDETFFTFTITKEVENSTPELFLAYCEHWASTKSPDTAGDTQGIFDEAIVTIRKTSPNKPLAYLIYKFKDAWVRSWELSAKAGKELPEEKVEFCFNTCEMSYYPQKEDGSLGVLEYGGWDFRESGPITGG